MDSVTKTNILCPIECHKLTISPNNDKAYCNYYKKKLVHEFNPIANKLDCFKCLECVGSHASSNPFTEI